MNEELKKSLTDLIDETLLELEELKKSRFSASEIDIKGPGEGIAGKPSNGDLHAKAEDKKDKDEDEEEAEKAEGQNRQSDPDGGHHKPVAGEGMKNTNGRHSESPGASVTHGNGKNSESDPGNTQHESDTVSKKDEECDDKDKKKDKKKDAKGGEDHEDKEKKAIKDLSNLAGMKKGDSPSPEEVDKQMRAVAEKSQKESESLMKSYVDDKVKPLEDKLSTILDLVNKIADQPVAPKGVTGRTVPLLKSTEDGEQLSKSEVASKLFELKKSGTKVDSLDVTRAEMGQDLSKIMEKYKIS
jgi:hypothetical protein